MPPGKKNQSQRRITRNDVWIGGSSTFLLSTQSALYYDSLKVTPSNLSAIATGGPRQVLVALLRPRGYLANAASFRIYSIHFKAGSGSGTWTSSLRMICDTRVAGS